MTVPVLVIGLLVAVIVVLVLIIGSIKRHRSPHLRSESDEPIEKLVTSLAGLCLGTPIQGNSVETSRTARSSTS